MVRMAGGSALNGYGGVVSISSGSSHEHSSGAIAINSANSGFSGSSGEAEIFTGKSVVGDSGHITLDTGESMLGRGGDISIKIGKGFGEQNGGNVQVKAGDIQATEGAPRGAVLISSVDVAPKATVATFVLSLNEQVLLKDLVVSFRFTLEAVQWAIPEQ
jgi:hypothetical protein